MKKKAVIIIKIKTLKQSHRDVNLLSVSISVQFFLSTSTISSYFFVNSDA